MMRGCVSMGRQLPIYYIRIGQGGGGGGLPFDGGGVGEFGGQHRVVASVAHTAILHVRKSLVLTL